MGQKIKRAENVSTNTLKLFYAKNGSKKKLIFKKYDHFKNCHNAKSIALAKYSLWVKK